MGTTTPNIGLYIPADGETNYGTSFANGMLNLDTHDHSGAPNNGVPLSASGLAPGSVTADKLNSDVLSPGGGLSFDVNNAIQTDGVLKAIFGLSSNGIIVRLSSTTAAARTIQTGNVNRLTVTNGDGVAGDPTLNLPNVPDLTGINNSAAPLQLQQGGVAQALLSSQYFAMQNQGKMNSFQVTTTGIANGATANIFTVAPSQSWLITAYADGAAAPVPRSLGFATYNTTNLELTAVVATACTLGVSGADITLTNSAGGTLAFNVSAIRLF